MDDTASRAATRAFLTSPPAWLLIAAGAVLAVVIAAARGGLA